MSNKPPPTRRQVKAFVDALLADGCRQDTETLTAEGSKWSRPPTLADFGITHESVVAAEMHRAKGQKRVGLCYKAAGVLAWSVYLIPAFVIVAGFFAEDFHEAVQNYGRTWMQAATGAAIWTMLASPFITLKWAVIAVVTWVVMTFIVLANEDRINGAPNTTLKLHADYLRACKAYEAAEERQKRDFWTGLGGHTFEHELANLLRRVGHKAQVTRGSGDDGIDIISEIDGESVVFQCKRYSGSVGPALVREFYGSLMHHGADRGVIATTGSYTQGAIDFAEDKPIDLWTLDEILALQQAAGQSGRR